MRVAFSMTYEKMTVSINQKRKDIDTLSYMAASGMRLANPSDDPLAWSRSMEIRQGLRELETFGKNVDFGIGWNQTAENALSRFSDLLTQAKQIAIEALSGTYPEEQTAQVNLLEQISREALHLANTRYGDLYIFSGQTTDIAPFDATAPLDAATLDYKGGTEAVKTRVGKNNQQTVNLDGQTVFGLDPADPTSNILKELLALRDAIQLDDQTLIKDQMGKMDAAYQHITSQRTVVGSRLSGFERQKDVLSSIVLEDQKRLEDLSEADMAEVIIQLQQKQTAFEAALQVTSQLKNLNLLNFL